MAKEEENRKKKILIRVIIFLLVVLILASTYFFIDKIENLINFAYNGKAPSTQIDNQGLKIHFIDVDQADAILIEFPTGEKMLIDAGDDTKQSGEKLFNYLDKITFKEEDGEKVIDYFVMTHSHADHIGNAYEVFQRYKIKYCYRPNIRSASEETINPNTAKHDSALYEKVINALANEVLLSGCKSQFTYADLSIKSKNFSEENLGSDNATWKVSFLTPILNDLPYKEGSSFNFNNYSPIMILEYMSKKFMFTGDAEKVVEEDLLEDYARKLSLLDVDVLKVGHHGSKTSSCDEFLQAVKPEYAIIECGKDNKYNHPDEETIVNLKEVGLTDNDIYRTDKNGTILVGVSRLGELSLIADYVQYTTFKIEWWQLFVGGTIIAAVIILLPIFVKKKKKKTKKS